MRSFPESATHLTENDESGTEASLCNIHPSMVGIVLHVSRQAQALLARPLAFCHGVIAVRVATIKELDGAVAKRAGEGERRRISGRHGRTMIFSDAEANRGERHQVERNRLSFAARD